MKLQEMARKGSMVLALAATLAGCGGLGQGNGPVSAAILPQGGLSGDASTKAFTCLPKSLGFIVTFNDGSAGDFASRTTFTSSNPAVAPSWHEEPPAPAKPQAAADTAFPQPGAGTSFGVPPPPPPPTPNFAVGTNVHFGGFAGCSVAALRADGSVDINIPGVGIRPRVARSAVRWLDGAPAPAFAGSATPAPGHASTPVEWVPPITIKNAPKPPPKHTEPWSCSACTLINSPHRSTCGACETAAPPPPSRSAVSRPPLIALLIASLIRL